MCFRFFCLWIFIIALNNVGARSFAPLVAKVTPSVVSIISHGQGPERDRDKTHALYTQDGEVHGSGFIIHSDGYIVTNFHNVKNAHSIKVVLHDSTLYEGQLVGKDSLTDLAVLKIHAHKKLPALRWGESDELNVGDWILVIGNPFGFEGTVAAGIISAKSRQISDESLGINRGNSIPGFLQTDASISVGSSGGPMIDMKGSVVGVNTIFVSPTDGSSGLGFSIPSSVAAPIVKDLQRKGEVKRPWVGVDVQKVTERIAQYLNLSKPKGALVIGVSTRGPALQAGIQVGDVILAVDGKEILDAKDFPKRVAKLTIDQDAQFLVQRKNQKIKIVVHVIETSMDKGLKGLSKEIESLKNINTISQHGLKMIPLTSSLKSSLGLSAIQEGKVWIEDVSTDKTSILPNSILLTINHVPVESSKHADALIQENFNNNPDRPVLCLLVKDGHQYFATIDL